MRSDALRRYLAYGTVAAAVGWSLGLPGLTGTIGDAKAQDDAKRLAYGRHLAAECTSCHRIDGVDNGIPSITGWPVRNFVDTMDFYRTGARANQVMVSVTQSLDDAQIMALAAYYGSLPKPAKAK